MEALSKHGTKETAVSKSEIETELSRKPARIATEPWIFAIAMEPSLVLKNTIEAEDRRLQA